MTHDDAIHTLATERYLLDEMPELERHAFEEHYFDCQICAADVRAGAALVAAAGTVPAATSATQPSPAGTVVSMPPRRGVTTFASLAAAAALGLVAGYQTFVAVPALRARLVPQMVAPTVLTPTTRGDAPVIPLAGPSPLVLSLDVNLTTASDELVYDVRREAGDRVATGRIRPPLPGTPLLLLLAEPPTTGTYVVTLRGSNAADAGENTYRFTVR
jgi:hypothetical protein